MAKRRKNTASPLLTKKQLFCLVNYVVFMIVGLLVFVLAWDMPFVDALHNAVIIYTTVGYGFIPRMVEVKGTKEEELVYDNPRMMIFLILYITWGVAVILFAIDVVLEFFAEKAKKKKDSAAQFKFITKGKKADHKAQKVRSILDSPIFWVCLDLFVKIAGASFIMWLDYVELYDFDNKRNEGGVLNIPNVKFQSKGSMDQLLIATYFGFVTGSSVGFGVLEPQSHYARLFCFLWIPATICLTANSFTYFLQWFMSKVFDVEAEEKRDFKMKIYGFLSTKDLFEHMDMEGDGKIHMNEFIIQVLLNACDINIEDINIIKEFIQKLDTVNDGYLDRAEFQFQERMKILKEYLNEDQNGK